MSRLDDIKEQLKATGQKITQTIQESAWFAQAQDRYQSLNPSSQKIVLAGSSIVILFLLIFYPMSLFFSSQSIMTTFEDKRALIRDLFRTYRESSARPNISIPPAFESLKSSVNSIITTADLLPEQNLGMMEGSFESKLIPQSLVTHVLEVKLAKLNLKQIVDIGSSIVGISNSVKMKDLLISANTQDSRYFDVTYSLYSLNVPEPTPEPPPEVEAKPKKGSATSKSKKDESTKGSDE